MYVLIGERERERVVSQFDSLSFHFMFISFVTKVITYVDDGSTTTQLKLSEEWASNKRGREQLLLLVTNIMITFKNRRRDQLK